MRLHAGHVHLRRGIGCCASAAPVARRLCSPHDLRVMGLAVVAPQVEAVRRRRAARVAHQTADGIDLNTARACR